MDVLQYVHFLASAYVALVILKGREQILFTPVLRPFVKCGQQALSIFTSGMVLSYIGGMIFDHQGTGLITQLWVNAIAFALLFAIGYGVAWFKRAPWKRGVGVAMAAADVFFSRRCCRARRAPRLSINGATRRTVSASRAKPVATGCGYRLTGMGRYRSSSRCTAPAQPPALSPARRISPPRAMQRA